MWSPPTRTPSSTSTSPSTRSSTTSSMLTSSSPSTANRRSNATFRTSSSSSEDWTVQTHPFVAGLYHHSDVGLLDGHQLQLRGPEFKEVGHRQSVSMGMFVVCPSQCHRRCRHGSGDVSVSHFVMVRRVSSGEAASSFDGRIPCQRLLLGLCFASCRFRFKAERP